MALRTIRLDGDPILRKTSKNIDNINDRIKTLLNDMVETMVEANGVGLAAPQVGILRRAVVIDIGDGVIKMINPEIIEQKGSDVDVEGCLSIPGKSGTVKRPLSVKVKFLNENGEEQILEGTGLLARAICHEIDHLNGILYTDKVIEYVDVEYEDEEH
ncbi:peptide deformylase [Wansuia hejianensis]|uniref:Peptide deformylase n=1 Tax=Wansuia hejianensis TaxID=2763667 RepID=A0A926F201_9FIRM|nr:peptide deformylase [Wansuia hejianensis]MBC8590454.1 peptide deformylase [Wansuia hejianensis]